MDVVLARTLYKWAVKNPDNLKKLESWLETAIENVASGNGASLQSTSANGVSVAFAGNGLTNAQWVKTLSLAIGYVDSPPVSKIRNILR